MPVHYFYFVIRGALIALLMGLTLSVSAHAQQAEPSAKPSVEPAANAETTEKPAVEPAASPSEVPEAKTAPEHSAETPFADQPAAEVPPNPEQVANPGPVIKRKSNTTADHSKFKGLQGPFASGSEVTQACLKCHNNAGHQFMKSIHWTWKYTHPKTGQKLGKRRLINNFCTNARGNEGMCAVCHASYNWSEATAKTHFDVTDQNQKNIDCLVCHDSTGAYYKTPPTRGNPACAVMFEGLPQMDLAKIAQNVALPSRANCGACHFNGGGGDGVKHGDLDSSLKHPSRSLDVHMDEKGLNFACTKCHLTKKHVVAGSRYDMLAKDTGGTGKPGMRRDVASCESCHGNTPHPNTKILGIKLNSHTRKVACQTCHIPALARGGVATVVDWDWRTAGKLNEKGEGFQENNYHQGDGNHRHTYRSIKGNFVYGETWSTKDTERLKKQRAEAKKDGEHKEEHYKYPTEDRKLLPHYAWFDGTMKYTTIDTKFDPAKQPIEINGFSGSYKDPKSRIWPFKRMHTVQPYDKGNNTLVYMQLWGEGDKAYWGNYDFDKAITEGMRRNGIPYSGKRGFIETYSYWPTTHMVAPKEKALKCGECHSKNGRLANLTGFYMPGRDGLPWLDFIGYLILIGAIGGVILHAILRLLTRRFRKGNAHD